MPNMPASKHKEAAAATVMVRKVVFFMFISPKARGELDCPISALGLRQYFLMLRLCHHFPSRTRVPVPDERSLEATP